VGTIDNPVLLKLNLFLFCIFISRNYIYLRIFFENEKYSKAGGNFSWRKEEIEEV